MPGQAGHDGVEREWERSDNRPLFLQGFRFAASLPPAAVLDSERSDNSPSPEERGWGEGNVDRNYPSSDAKSACEADALAEEEGFEPPVPCSTTVFKTAAIDHSAIPP